MAENTPGRPKDEQPTEARQAAWEGKPWRKFERVVAAVHKFRDQGAEVRWNEKIAGRQVDVSVRFERGGYRYLLLVECKNYKEAVPVKEVEAFVTKSRRLSANKAIVVAANGFQRGAETEAAHHGLELYTLQEVREAWEQTFITTNERGIHIHGIVLWPRDRAAPIILPNRPDVLTDLRFDPTGWPANMPLGEVAQRGSQLDPADLIEEQAFRLRFPRGCRVRAASLAAFAGAAALNIRALDYKARCIVAPVRNAVRPPDVPLWRYVYENAVTGERATFGMDLPIGLDNTFRAGAFYRNIMDIAYKCESVDGDKARMFVFINQHGRQLGARVVMDTKHSPLYVEITAAAEIAALEDEYQLWMKADPPGAA